jgi:outer membrane protein TolC
MFRKEGARKRVGLIILFLAAFMGAARSSGAQEQSPFLGSVPTGQAGGTLDLSLSDTFDRALKYNLGVVESNQSTRAAHATRLRTLNALLPNLSARISGTLEQVNLGAEGVSIHIPGVKIPIVVGPFAVEDARAYLSQEIFNWSEIKNWKSASEFEKASQYSYKSDRDFVILTSGSTYLLVISDAANVESITAQVKTAETLHHNSVDQNRAGVIASIDVLRAQVELQTQQQRLIAARNQLAIDKLTLARIIGLPNGQEFRLADSVPYAPLGGVTLEQALQQARSTRPDYLSAKARVSGSELARQAAAAENYPSLSMGTNFGDIGSPNLGTSRETFSFDVALNIPIFQGSLVRADKLQSDTEWEQRKAELADLEGRIDDDVRTAFFNFQSSSELVAVAKSNIELANQTLTQANDRFAAGVADNLEVVQAQESVASANQSYIASLYSFNLAKLSLARAVGVAEQSALQYLGVK